MVLRRIYLRRRCRLCVINVTCVLLSSILLCLVTPQHWWNPSYTGPQHQTTIEMKSLNWSAVQYAPLTRCRFHSCFDINRCVYSTEDRIKVHVGGPYSFLSPFASSSLTPEFSVEYAELVEAVKGSRYYHTDPSKACVFIPPLDTLNQHRTETPVMSTLLNSLPNWFMGRNNLIFNMLPGDPPHFNTTPNYYYGMAMLAGAGLKPPRFRTGFDISIPVYNPLTKNHAFTQRAASNKRPRLLTVLIHGDYKQVEGVESISQDMGDQLLLLQTMCPGVSPEQLPRKRCSFKSSHTHPFPDILLSSKFCLLLWGAQTGMLDFTDIMMTGCIPVVVSGVALPFSDVLDWTLASIQCPSCELEQVVEKLRSVPEAMVAEWRSQVLYLYNRYFSSMAAIVLATLDIIDERVFPISARSYGWWNKGYELSHIARYLNFFPPNENEGFTALILSYKRLPSLFKVIENVAKAPSCVRIIVVWNNVDTPPPPAKEWPQVKQHLEIIRSKENKLSNRFYPYFNLTSAVLSLDDDITMLTVDELEFAFKAWLEFPNRLVGFPGRVHVWKGGKESQHWKYESTWLNNISLVLTGAAFYHKYFHYLYTYEMPQHIREWVDRYMNCEDIAMNFLISNYTGLPPLKVSPRKKFVCRTCSSERSLWTDESHYVERDECINIFEHFFGGMPLKTVKFRLDPILYKAGVPLQQQDYPDMGEL